MAKAKKTATESQPESSGGDSKTPEKIEGEVHSFQTEMQQLLQIIIHSLYAEREIFLRELISNASDAINKYKFIVLTQRETRDTDAELEITLEADPAGKTLTLSDSGIGMTREEAISNLGTIARSGTLEFVRQLTASEPGQRGELIGQFGVGFYSVFMVAKRVVVDSLPADPKLPGVRWVSDGHGQYTVAETERTRRGTSIRIEFKDDAEEFSQGVRLERIVQRYSSFIAHPIRLDGRRLNVQEAIWARSKGDVTPEQHKEFYNFVTHGTGEPLHTAHLSIDAPVQYQALLYVPPNLTNEVLYSPTAHGVALYANKVLIQQDAKDVLPIYLRFLRGVVDSADLPLNVSRETVQNNPLLGKLRTSLAGRLLREFKSLAESDTEKYNTLWHQYGKVLKEGLTGDPTNRERLLELLRFNSSTCQNSEELISLKDYVGRMQPDQKEILYFTGPSREAIERNPHLEIFKRKGLEVLYLTDPVDDFMMAQMYEHEGKSFASIDQQNLESLKDAEPPQPEGPVVEGPALEALLAHFKTALGTQVSDVRISRRLVDSPALLVSSDGMPGNLGKMMRMLNKDFKSLPKVLEINPGHALMRGISERLTTDSSDPLLKELAEQVLDNCLLVEGVLEHPERMVGRIQSLMTRATGVKSPPTGA